MNILKKLPSSFQTDKTLSKIAELISQSKIYFSSIFYRKGDDRYLIKKEQGVPYFQKDWQAFSILRASSKVIIETGAIIRAETGLFKTRSCFGDKDLEELYDNLQGSNIQKIYMLTKKMTTQEIQTYLNPTYYQLIPHNNNSDKISTYLQQVQKMGEFPINLEVGIMLFEKYMKEVTESKQMPLLDTLMVTNFYGELEERFYERRLEVDIGVVYEVIWESEKLEVNWKGEKIGYVVIEVYQRRKI